MIEMITEKKIIIEKIIKEEIIKKRNRKLKTTKITQPPLIFLFQAIWII